MQDFCYNSSCKSQHHVKIPKSIQKKTCNFFTQKIQVHFFDPKNPNIFQRPKKISLDQPPPPPSKKNTDVWHQRKVHLHPNHSKGIGTKLIPVFQQCRETSEFNTTINFSVPMQVLQSIGSYMYYHISNDERTDHNELRESYIGLNGFIF